MDPGRAQELAERDQMWASLRALRPAIDRLGDGHFDPAGEGPRLVVLLARIVAAELDYRARDADDQASGG